MMRVISLWSRSVKISVVVVEVCPREQAKAIVKQVPLSAEAHNALARALVDERRYVEAIRVSRTAEKLEASRYQTHLYLGIALTAIGQPETGFAELQRAVELNSRDSFLHFHLAMGYISRGQPANALVHLQTSVAMQPDDPVDQYNLGVLYLHLNQPKNAINSLRKVLEISPEYPAPDSAPEALASSSPDWNVA